MPDTSHSRKSQRSGDPRTPFQIDRDRITFSYAFRRLQSKTQVFQSGDYDFYRTRLTHSIEVAKIGRSIVERMNYELAETSSGLGLIDVDLVEAACLAHDLGHPPFGHIGERTLNACMAPHGGFEGNAQTLRILTHLIFERPDRPVGMNPTRAFVDATLKYKTTFSSLVRTTEAGKATYPKNHFIYDEQESVLNWVQETGPGFEKSLECQIMDWADDTAYSLNDLSDGIQAGYLTSTRIHQWMEQQEDLDEADVQDLDKLRERINDGTYERRHAAKVGQFISALSLETDDLNDRSAWRLKVDGDIARQCSLYKRIAVDLIFRSPQIQQNEFRGRHLLIELFDAVMDTYLSETHDRLSILPSSWDLRIRQADSDTLRIRYICDALSALTDGEAIRLYQKLFRADYGSLSDLA